MSGHFLFHSSTQEITPFYAKYSFPVQTTRTLKSTVKIPSRESGPFNSKSPSRITLMFPAQAYLNAPNSVLAFDFHWVPKASDSAANVRFTNSGVHGLFKRLTVRYGSMVIEDIQDYHTLARMVVDTVVSSSYRGSPLVVGNGSGTQYFTNNLNGRVVVSDTANADTGTDLPVASDAVTGTGAYEISLPGCGNLTEGLGSEAARTAVCHPCKGTAGNPTQIPATARRFTINLMSGILNNPKLIPLKWMASNLTIELELAEVGIALDWEGNADDVDSFTLSRVEYITEMLEFDSSYDAAFYATMMSGGIPIKFSSWHNYKFPVGNASTTDISVNIPERARAVKAAYAVITPQTNGGTIDNTAFLWQGCRQYQWRVGGKYYPSQPVDCTKGGAEAFLELQKALGTLGNYAINCHINDINWCKNDYMPCTVTSGVASAVSAPGARGTSNFHKFIMCADFETSNGLEISGMNAEEMNDLQLIIKFGAHSLINSANNAVGTITGTTIPVNAVVFTNYDGLIIVRPNNEVDLIM